MANNHMVALSGSPDGIGADGSCPGTGVAVVYASVIAGLVGVFVGANLGSWATESRHRAYSENRRRSRRRR